MTLFPQFKTLITIVRSRKPINKERNENLNSFSSNRKFLEPEIALPYFFQMRHFRIEIQKAVVPYKAARANEMRCLLCVCVCVCVCVYNKRAPFIRQNQLRKLYQIFAKIFEVWCHSVYFGGKYFTVLRSRF